MRTKRQRSLFLGVVLACLLIPVAAGAARPDENPGKGNGPGNGGPGGGGPGPGPGNGGGSSQFHQNYFTNNPYEGTESCLGSKCHDKEAEDVLATGHWNWQGVAANIEGFEEKVHGKRDFINNFCIAVPTNEGRCAQCHIGYGYVDQSFDFDDPNKIDCLICHDQTGTYKKGKTTGGLPDLDVVELQAVARSVGDNGGVPGRRNCIVCHANAGGGDNVKHGDLAMALLDTKRKYDVHMATNGGDMTCVACHDVDRNPGGKPISHGIGGMPYHSVDEGTMVQCVDCHDPSTIHKRRKVREMLETHERLACQVCHIPAIARQTATKVEWYWAKAGDLERDPVIDPVTGQADYDPKKGEFVWAFDVRPVLRFHNGKWHKTMIATNDVLAGEPVDLGSPAADRSDPDAMIYPFKKMIGDQIADAAPLEQDHQVFPQVLVPHLFKATYPPMPNPMPNPYWDVYDWPLAILDAIGYPTGQFYSGEHKFVQTEMLLAVNHEIAPKGQSLGKGGKCSDCHGQGPDGEDLIDWPALGWDEDPYKEKQKGKKKQKGKNK